MKILKSIIIPLFIMATTLMGQSLTLEAFQNKVLNHSKILQLAQKDKDIASYQKREAVSTALPKIIGQANYTRNLTEYYMYADMSALTGGEGGIVKFKVKQDNEFSANIVLQQTLFSPSVGSAIKAAQQFANLTDFIYEANRQVILTEASKLFYQGLLLEKVWEVARATEINAKENFEQVNLKFEHGQVSEFQLVQSEMRWKNAIPGTALAQRNHDLLINTLKQWAGLSTNNQLKLIGNLESTPDIPIIVSFDDAAKKRPDINALTWEKALRATDVSNKKGAYLPTLTGSLIYAYTAQSDRFKLEQDNGLAMAGLSLTLPIYLGGYRKTQIDKAKVEMAKTQIRIDQARESLYNELANVKLRLKEAHQRIASADATLKTANKAFNIAQVTTKNGLSTQLELKDARMGFDQAQLGYYVAVYDYMAAYFDWQKATGHVE
ncbi:TolC family protein [bacterium]|nr:TolC family protein [bacterium]